MHCAVIALVLAQLLPPDQRAFEQARRLADPAARMAALEQVLKQYPRTAGAERIRRTILELAAEQGVPALRQRAAELAAAVPEADRPRINLLTLVIEEKLAPEDAALRAQVDALYREVWPNPVKVTPFERPVGGHTVLLEVFTGAGCPPCVASSLAVDAALERYRRKDLIVVMYHQNIPVPDPLSNADSAARWREAGEPGIPLMVIDGQAMTTGGPRSRAVPAWERLEARLAERLPAAAAPVAKVSIKRRKGKLTVSAPKDAEVVLVEELVRYTGENGMRFHPMVARARQHGPAAAFELPVKAAPHGVVVFSAKGEFEPVYQPVPGGQ
ncbi:MAG: hypothetical protein NTZ56_05480 [Acidobacteria bacterium]|nr:hypothetical protein [Acidobacteriota bacterium]